MGGGKGGGDIDGLEDMADVQLELGQEQAKIARDYLKFSQKQYADNQQTLKPILDTQLATMREQLKYGREDRARYDKIFAPMEEAFAKEAKGYDTGARREAEAGRAGADVATAAQAARENAAQTLESFGIDPSTTRAHALDRKAALDTALSTASAENQARTRVEDTGRTMRTNAINLGRGFPAQANAGYGAAGGAGTAAAGTHMAPGQQLNQNQSVAQNWFSGANSGIAGAAATQGQVAQLSGQTPWLDATSGIAGMALGGWLGRSEGGSVAEAMAEGTPPGPGDTVPVMMNPREYVLPADVVARKGTEFLDRFVESTRKKAMPQQEAR